MFFSPDSRFLRGSSRVREDRTSKAELSLLTHHDEAAHACVDEVPLVSHFTDRTVVVGRSSRSSILIQDDRKHSAWAKERLLSHVERWVERFVMESSLTSVIGANDVVATTTRRNSRD